MRNGYKITVVLLVFVSIVACSAPTAASTAPASGITLSYLSATPEPFRTETEAAATQPESTRTPLFDGVTTPENTCIALDEHGRAFVLFIPGFREIVALSNNVRAIGCYMALPDDIQKLWMVTTPPVDIYTSMVLVGKLDGSELPAINMVSKTKTDVPFITSDQWVRLDDLTGNQAFDYGLMKEIAGRIEEGSILIQDTMFYP